MLIKSADDNSEDIAELNALLAKAKPNQKKRIQEELRNLEKGAWGEHDAAYFLNFHFEGYKNTIILHDLRLVLSNGKTAQIDHLVITKWLDIYVLESKNWIQLTVNEAGDCTRKTWDGRIVGVDSPLEQCKRHANVLKRTFQLDPQLKAFAPRQNIKCRVLVATGCHLSATYHREWYVKVDAFHSAWEKDIDNESMVNSVLSLTRIVSRESLIKIGQALVALHNPGRMDWRAKFGFSSSSDPVKEKTPVNNVVSSINGLSNYVPRWGKDWFVLQGKPTDATKKAIKAAGYRASQENGEWIWRLKV